MEQQQQPAAVIIMRCKNGFLVSGPNDPLSAATAFPEAVMTNGEAAAQFIKFLNDFLTPPPKVDPIVHELHAVRDTLDPTNPAGPMGEVGQLP